MRFEPLEDRRLLAVFLVHNKNDSGAGSLRAAMDAANNSIGIPDEIIFSVSGTINIASQLPTITDPLTITGPGANLLTINAGNGVDQFPATFDGFGVFYTVSPTTPFQVKISDLTITGGDSEGRGGAIDNRVNLTLTDCRILGNSAFDGGGIYNTGTMTITGSTISGNSANSSQGGGIFNYVGFPYVGKMTISGSTISGNSASHGGGLLSLGGTVTITNSTISGNAVSSDGGGIGNLATTMTIASSTIASNYSRRGGGIFNYGTTTITNSTISRNSASIIGGGIYNIYTANIANSTISGNSAGEGGGIFNYVTTNIAGSLITGNSAPTASEIRNVLGAVVPAAVNLNGYNLIGESSKTTAQALSGVSAGPNDILATSDGTVPTELAAIIAPLANNGGPTPTHALVAGSPAINAGSPVVDLAPGGVATQSSEYEYSWLPAGKAIDGNPATFTHTASADANATWQLTRASDFVVTQVVLHNRLQNQSRLRDITVEVLDSAGAVVATSALLNPENILGGGTSATGPATLSFDLVAETGGPVVGRTIRVRRTPDPDLSGSGGQGNESESNVLSLSEVEVLGVASATDQRGVGYERLVNGRVDIGAYELALSADFDGDGDVDGRDFLLWQRGYGTPAPTVVKSNGDADNDLDVDGNDLVVWRGEYGTGGLSALGSPLSAGEEGAGVGGQGTEIADLGSMIVDRRAVNVSDRSTPGANTDGSPYVDSYVEEVDRAIDELSSSTILLVKPAVAPFGQMVARRGARLKLAR
jgi:hypothetical protein